MARPAPLTARELNRATLARQGLLEPMAGTAADAVQRLGSLQAQHPEWPPIALAARAASPRTANLAGALARRRVVRSSLMRITIHVVAAEDLWPMFAAVQPLRLDQWRLLHKADPMTSALGRRLLASHEAAFAALRESPRTSLELDRIMSSEAGIDAGSATTRPAWRDPETRVVVRSAWRHLAATVPLVHVPFDGERYGRSRYALAADWLGVEPPELDLAAARALVARRYLAAFGPATVEDLAAYVGRGKGGIGVWREAVATLAGETVELVAEDGRRLLDLEGAPRPAGDTPAPPRLLARWDSIVLSHAARARGRIIADAHRERVHTKNADVLPTILVDGMVAGTWELVRGGGEAAIRIRPFGRLDPTVRRALADEAERVLALVEPDARRSVGFGR